MNIKTPLYQHTPMIHFQGEQTGATLRATEVKPRLDRFIISRTGKQAAGAAVANYSEAELYEKGWEYLKVHHPSWLSKSDDPRQRSLNYRMKITAGASASPHGKMANTYANYFADTGNEKKAGETTRPVTFHEVVMLELATPADDLAILLDPNTDGSATTAFFYANNFGTRQSKGFGSFSPAVKPPKDYAFKFFLGVKDHDQLFRYLELFNRSVRTGINKVSDPDNGRFNAVKMYMKPLLFCYAADQGIVWEKKLIKEAHGGGIYENNRRPTKTPPHSPPDESAWPAWYDGGGRAARKEATVRDVLGLATDQSWMGYDNKKVTKKSTKAESDQSIDRSPSPFTYVPVRMSNGFAIYVYVQQPSPIYLDHAFNINFGNDRVGTNGQVKVFPNFSMRDFLQTYFRRDYVDGAIVRKVERDKAVANTLLDIYEQIETHLDLENIQPA